MENRNMFKELRAAGLNTDNTFYTIAEIGINHSGNINKAKKLIDAAKESGADSVKFQTYRTEKRVGNINKKVSEILKRCELGYKDFIKINNYCTFKKITFFSTPFDEEAVDFLESINVPFYKIASVDIANYQLIKKILKTKKPAIASTGMASYKEIIKIDRMFKARNSELAILHCVSSYPNEENSSYLSNIPFLLKKFKRIIGISDHTSEIKIPIYGNILGANIIEKHLKINSDHKCVDSQVSITGEQMKILKEELNKIKIIINEPKFGIRKSEKGTVIFRRKKMFNQ